ncbi:hypothetical protein F7P75_14875 [Acinetobacter gandensis]|uniref:Uncharacterized protein n=1 Tax=Acinetobacter gandensis TaxID=1443941 RepID=A0A1A7RAE2_9GAMM|nr:hypothetical protein [Acinetobacter gandensis]KAB0622551.1 hypothetical protein F7P75_14875 [Acinetobacter gandensis]OBX28891.1 hypothetical protein A9J31_15110 [Acinetobacter gandensis]
MAFDLVQYFAEQIESQKPMLLSHLDREEKRSHIRQINALTLGELINQLRSNGEKVYQEISNPDELYIQEVSRHLTTNPSNASTLSRTELEQLTTEVFHLQLLELKQLHDTGSHSLQSIRELLNGQIEHLSGQADDWVWSTNNLTELLGSKPNLQEDISLEASMKEFNQMVHQQNAQHDDNNVAVEATVPTWSKVVEPVVAIAILWILYSAATNMFA